MAASDLTTLSSVKAWLAILDGASDTLISGLITSMSRAIYTKIQRPNLLPMAYSEMPSIPPSNRVMLKAWPVVSISSVTIGPRTVPAASPSYGGNGYVLETVDPAPPSRPQSLYLGAGNCYGGGGWSGWSYLSAAISYTAGYQVGETQTIAGAALTAEQPYGAWGSDQGVVYASSGVALTKVAASPTQGQYAPSATYPGLYTFNAADNGAAVTLSYGYFPADLAQACIEWIAARFKSKEWIGVKSKSLGGQETMSYDTGAMPDFVMRAVHPFKRVTMV